MPIFVAVVRVCLCSICEFQWYLQAGEPEPETCVHCGAGDWKWGPDNKESRLIRQRIQKLGTVKNKGAKSLKRRERARKSGGLLKPKGVESRPDPEDT